ncbi:DedA family protein [Streptomyces sp. NPDC005899]|uniref:DedA family protein n=1 Tax=Streptomyces sp. NPDC005899 TaxID=3155716 RepID=UPI0033C08D23
MNTLALGPSWLDPDYLLNTFGLPGLLLIVFAESGLLIGFFLPGDSLLFTTGLLVTTGDLKYPLWLVCVLVALAAIIGDQVGYLFGRKVGPSLFKRPDSRLFKQENVEKAHEFFEKYGPKSLVLARFVPIVRTFTPIIAGVSRMDYRSFITFNIIGGVLWGVGVTLLGAALGQIDFVHENIEMILILIVLISVVPIAIEFLRARGKSKKAAAADERRQDDDPSGTPAAGAAGQFHGRDEDPYAGGGQGAAYDAGPYTAGPGAGPYGPGGAAPYGDDQGHGRYGQGQGHQYGGNTQAGPYGHGHDAYGDGQAAPYGDGRQYGDGYAEPYGSGQGQYGGSGQGQYGGAGQGQGQYGSGQGQYGTGQGQGQYGSGQGQGQYGGNAQAGPYGGGPGAYGGGQAAPYGSRQGHHGDGQADPYGEGRPYGDGQAAPRGDGQEGDAGSYGWRE